METTLTVQEKTLIISALIAYKQSQLELVKAIRDPTIAALYKRNAEELEDLINQFIDKPVRQPNHFPE